MWVRKMKESSKQPDALITVLLDASAEYGDRDDAAMDLGGFDHPAAEAALVAVASDPATDEELADTCGEALAAVWLRRGKVDEEVLPRLHPASLRVCIATLRASSSQLASDVEALLAAVQSRK